MLGATDSSWASRLVLLAGAAAIGIACGTAAKSTKNSGLPAAGTARDDGSGFLARASASLRRGGKNSSGGYGAAGYTTGNWSYGGGGYGSAGYGGGIYANYKFATGSIADSDVADYAANYVVDETLPTGRIVGRVRWGVPPRHDRLAAATECGESVEAANENPEHVVVYLRKIRRGRGFPTLEGYPVKRWQVGGVLKVASCRLSPYVQVVGPIGGILRAVLADEGPDRLVERAIGAPLVASKKDIDFDVAFSARGDERIGQIRKAGPAVLANRRGALAWVMVADHPYYVAVDPGGSFALLDVPAGTYELVAWHPPVALAPGKLSAPLVVSRSVTVRANKKTRAELRLPRAK